jgi:16S rRNA A1518/A1519 N6-dimethyltransferase RsmA/KsgA/DIM1 with predicted DNA glycosylase/AP lyase activity
MVIAFVALLALFPVVMIWFLRHGAPFVRTSEDRTRIIIKEANRIKPKRIVDLGCGDGKLVIALAQAGYSVDGIEIQPWLAQRARREVRKLGLEDKINIYQGNFWNFDVSNYDVVVLFGIKHIMPRLERKFLVELNPRSFIISNFFVFPNLKAVRTNGEVRIFKV